MVAPFKEIKWMILGGESQLGRAFSAELSGSNVECISLNRAQLDVTNKFEIEERLLSTSPDVVINSAAWTNVDLAESREDQALLVNALAPRFLAESCAQIGAKFVQISTDYVFSGIATSPWSESSELSPISAYGRTKASGERFVLDVYPENSYIVRTAWLFSPWGKNFVKTISKIALEERRNVEVVSDQFGQPTSATDLAQQIHKLVNLNLTPGIYHGTNSGQASWFELAKHVFRLLGEDPKRVIAIDSSAFPRRAKRPTYSVLGHQKWSTEGMAPMRKWQDALEDAMPAMLLSINKGE
jgi:dTDP-4-dehydrorhamnose reductase